MVFGLVLGVFWGFGGVFCLFLGVVWYCIATVLLLVCLSGWGVVLSVGGLDEKRARWDSNPALVEISPVTFPFFTLAIAVKFAFARDFFFLVSNNDNLQDRCV